mmetsp:Transcript_71997/g.197137  ORF Transcript_71997/g.197137 Transcript_71997/m.197137 type:complete len:266 (-) Transcript_71997:284-1081(-)
MIGAGDVGGQASSTDAADDSIVGVGSGVGTTSGALYLDELVTAGGASGSQPPSLISVLVVDDDAFHRNVFARLFERANQINGASVVYDVTIAGSGREALEWVQPPMNILSPDLILVDIVMDDLSGDELLIMLRQILDPAVAIVMASSASQVGLVKKGLDLGADGFLVKPIHAHTIQLAWQYCYRKRGGKDPASAASSAGSDRRSRHPSSDLRLPHATPPPSDALAYAVGQPVTQPGPQAGLRPIRSTRDANDQQTEDQVGACKQQ